MVSGGNALPLIETLPAESRPAETAVSLPEKTQKPETVSGGSASVEEENFSLRDGTPEPVTVSGGNAAPLTQEEVADYLSSVGLDNATASSDAVVVLLEQIYLSEKQQEKQLEAGISILLWIFIGAVLYAIYRFLRWFI